jgi:hypothetical protein
MTPDPIDVPSGSSDFAFPSEQEMAGLPDGTYRMMVASSELATAKTSGALMWKIKLEVIEPASHLGRFVFDNLVFSHAAAGITFSKLKALGVGVQAGHQFNPSGGQHKDIVGKKVAVTTKLAEFNGQMSPKVAAMKQDPGPGGLGSPHTTAAVSASGAAKPSSAPTQPRSSSQVAEKPSSEELPF